MPPSARKKRPTGAPRTTRRLKSYFIPLLATISLLAVVGYSFRDSIHLMGSALPSDNLRSPATSADCVAPPGLIAYTRRDLEIASASIGKISVGTFKIHEQPEVIKLLSDTAADVLSIDYLVCKAERLGEIKSSSPAQADYLRRFWAFMHTKPTTDQFTAWMELNKLPPDVAPLEPTAFATPDFEVAPTDPDHDSSFVMNDLVEGAFRIRNNGNRAFAMWVERFQHNAFFIEPDLEKQKDVNSGEMINVTIRPTVSAAALGKNSEFDIVTSIPHSPTNPGLKQSHLRQKRTFGKTVHLSYANSDKIRDQLLELAAAAQRAVADTVSKPPGPPQAGDWRSWLNWLVANANASDAAALDSKSAQRISRAVTDSLMWRLKGDRLLAQYYTALLFDNFNWPDLAAVSYGILLNEPDDRFGGPTAQIRRDRAQYLATSIRTEADRNSAAEFAKHIGEKSLIASNQTVLDGASEWRNSNLLTSSDIRSQSEALARRMIAEPQLRAMGESLLADIYSASLRPQLACDHFVAASQIAFSPSLASRAIYPCLDSGRAGDFYEALVKLSKVDTTWVTNKLLSPINFYKDQISKRPTVLIEAEDASFWVKSLSKYWRKISTKDASFQSGMSDFCSGHGIIGADAKVVVSPVRKADDSPCTDQSAPQFAVVRVGYEVVGLSGSAGNASEEEFRKLLVRLTHHASGTMRLSPERNNGDDAQLPQRWIGVVASYFARSVCEAPAKAGGYSQVRECREQLYRVLDRRQYRDYGYDLSLVGPDAAASGSYAPISGFPLNLDSIRKEAYPWMMHVRAAINADHFGYNDGIPFLRYFFNSSYARSDLTESQILWEAD